MRTANTQHFFKITGRAKHTAIMNNSSTPYTYVFFLSNFVSIYSKNGVIKKRNTSVDKYHDGPLKPRQICASGTQLCKSKAFNPNDIFPSAVCAMADRLYGIAAIKSKNKICKG